MILDISPDEIPQKSGLLEHFRGVIEERVQELSELDCSDAAKRVNDFCNAALSDLEGKIANLESDNSHKLHSILTVFYSYLVVMIESRNHYRSYDKISLTRRLGEQWDKMMKFCFTYSPSDLEIVEPVDFSIIIEGIRCRLTERYGRDDADVTFLLSIIGASNISLKLDLHCKQDENRYHIDFKNSFNSNEKGNTNRLLTVAEILAQSSEQNNCLMLVRSEENNNYLERIRNSENWEVCCGNIAYRRIQEITGFDIGTWMDENVDFENDFDEETVTFFRQEGLIDDVDW